MAPRGAAPSGFCAALPPPPPLVAALAAAPAIWLVQLPVGFDARRLVGAKLRYAADESGGGRMTLDGGSRLRIVAEEDRLASQLLVASAPCAGQQGACVARAFAVCDSEFCVCSVRSTSRRVTAVLEEASQPVRSMSLSAGESAATAAREGEAAAGAHAFVAQQAGGDANGVAPDAAAEAPSGKANKRRRKGPA